MINISSKNLIQKNKEEIVKNNQNDKTTLIIKSPTVTPIKSNKSNIANKNLYTPAKSKK
jgi:hypothetical protein